MNAYVYIQSEFAGRPIIVDELRTTYYEHDLYTVGFYDPDGKWHPESDYNDKDQAAERVHYLNGGKP